MFLVYPTVDSDEFCDWYHEKKPTSSQTFEIMKNEINKNSNIQYSTSHFPDVSYKNGIVEESFPGHYYSFYTFGNDTMSTRFDFYFHPCRYESRIFEYYYGDDLTKIRIDGKTKTRNDYLSLDNTRIFEIFHDIALHKTHEKWLNLDNYTIYILPESSPTLVERKYLIEQKEFFDFDKS